VATAQAIPQTGTTSRASTLAIAGMLAFFGLSLVWLSGFANADVLHNGAHDSRHSLVFPCH
jgi:cobalt transporter subunit CbtB